MISPMVNFKVQQFTADAWKNTVSEFEGYSLLQTWEYAEAKSAGGLWTVERGLFTRGGITVGAAQVMIRRLPLVGGGLVWVNRGPLWYSSKIAFADVIKALKIFYVDDRGFYLRIAPPALEVDIAESSGKLAGERGWASAVLDLSNPLETLRAGLKVKWRGHLNKAERSELDIQIGTKSEFTTFLKSHTKFTATRNFDTSVTSEFLLKFQSQLPESQKLCAYLAYHSGELIGSVLMAKYGERCEYLAGNTTDQGRRLNVGQLLVWRAICTMKEQGLKSFDVSGMDPDVTPKGIYQFKEGLGGTPYRLAPEIEAGGDTIRGRLVRWRVNRARAGS